MHYEPQYAPVSKSIATRDTNTWAFPTAKEDAATKGVCAVTHSNEPDGLTASASASTLSLPELQVAGRPLKLKQAGQQNAARFLVAEGLMEDIQRWQPIKHTWDGVIRGLSD